MGSLQPWHIILVVVVAIVLFGSKRLPDATRSIGRSLRIFKAETKGVMSDDDGNPTGQQQYTAQAQPPQPAETPQPAQPPQPPAQQLSPGDGTTINGRPLSQPSQAQGPQNPS